MIKDNKNCNTQLLWTWFTRESPEAQISLSANIMLFHMGLSILGL
ncbi:MAG TPA: hypothetical protein VN704_09740 [Verrucomicrobiae bacterium]|nr:hypothetical protein [Verrucomicrobiae bacterium]